MSNKMRRMGLVVFLLSLVGSLRAESRIECNVLSSRILARPVHYCVLLPPGYDSEASRRYPVLYFLHGLGENERALIESGGWNLVEDLRQAGKIGDFLIVTPEAWASFYVNAAQLRYSDFFLEEFLPAIETRYRVRRERRSRAITGISMGGYGALRFAFRYPESFSAVSAESAALMTASPEELNSAIRSGTPLGRLLGTVFGNPIDVAHWKDNDPLVLAKRNQAAIRRVAIYFNCGREDEFQFATGAEALHRILDAEAIPHEYHLYPGDHSASYFLRHFDEVIEFHWKNFLAAK
ncbi:MAG TPA: alpha/beta hydrolase family protein [Terriglobales bacterium]|nr:alpha/beta hydrolase family protein [Terriglobales bacterium]